MFHSDQRTQYTSKTSQNRLCVNNIVQSFSRSERPHDNAVVETFSSYQRDMSFIVLTLNPNVNSIKVRATTLFSITQNNRADHWDMKRRKGIRLCMRSGKTNKAYWTTSYQCVLGNPVTPGFWI